MIFTLALSPRGVAPAGGGSYIETTPVPGARAAMTRADIQVHAAILQEERDRTHGQSHLPLGRRLRLPRFEGGMRSVSLRELLGLSSG
jgi:hypothetical protein